MCLALAIHLLVRRRTIRRRWRVALVHVAAAVFSGYRRGRNARRRWCRVLVRLVPQRRELPTACIRRCRLAAVSCRLSTGRVRTGWSTGRGGSGGSLALALILGLALGILFLFARFPFFPYFLEFCRRKKMLADHFFVRPFLVN